MKDRAEGLRRCIATYRRRLAEGLPSDIAGAYLADIARLERQLTEMMQRETRAYEPNPTRRLGRTASST
jgi:hypothetical protein